MRYFAIINTHRDIDIETNILGMLPKENTKILIFSTDRQENDTDTISIPEEIKNNNAKVINFVQKYFMDNNIKDYVHFIDDTIQITKNPDEFINEIEKMMNKLGLFEWYNTITDPMNYTFKIYNPRFSVALDSEDIKKVYDKTINFTSHSNTLWICYDFSKCTPELIGLDEDFEIPMYHIIKHLALKRNNKKPGDISYMNFYPTINEEKGVFKQIICEKEYESSQEEQNREAVLFREQNINHEADVVIEAVMDDIINRLTNI